MNIEFHHVICAQENAMRRPAPSARCDSAPIARNGATESDKIVHVNFVRNFADE